MYCNELNCFHYAIESLKQCLNCLLLNDKQFIAMQKHCTKYLNQPKLYVFKKCLNGFIVVFKKPNFCLSNEMRTDVVNSNFAKFRGSEFIVEDIIHMITLEHIQKLNHYFQHTKIIYEVGKLVQPNFFDCDINIVCGYGIHYYRSLEAAFYHDAMTNPTITFQNNGMLETLFITKGSKEVAIDFDDLGKLVSKKTYVDNILVKTIGCAMGYKVKTNFVKRTSKLYDQNEKLIYENLKKIKI